MGSLHCEVSTWTLPMRPHCRLLGRSSLLWWRLLTMKLLRGERTTTYSQYTGRYIVDSARGRYYLLSPCSRPE